MQAGAARREALGLGVVDAADQAHEFAGDIAVEPGRAERVLHCQPARPEDDKVDGVHARGVRRRLQHQEDRRIRVVEADRADGVEAAQVVLVRRVVAVPGHHVQRRMADPGTPQVALELGHQLEIALAVFIAGHRRQEVARVGQAVGADHAQVGQLEQRAVVLADIAARLAVRQLHAETHAARDHDDLLRFHFQAAQLGHHQQAPLLRHDQHLAVGVVEEAVMHRLVGQVQVDAATGHRFRAAITGHRHDAVDKVGRHGRHGRRAPAHLVRRRRHFVKSAQPAARLQTAERLVHGGRADAVQPRAAVVGARRREGGARDLLGIQAIGRALG
ncbi:hypothetical protein D3C81_989290 [compost metagenome]